MPALKHEPRSMRDIKGSIYRFERNHGREFPTYLEKGERFLQNVGSRFYKIGGRNYLVDLKPSKWDSPLSIAVSINVPGRDSKITERKIFEAPVGFRGNGVVIKTLQGELGVSREIRDFEKAVRMSIANFLCSFIEGEAKSLGFKYVYIRRPEENVWFQHPLVGDELRREKEPGARQLLGRDQRKLTQAEFERAQKYREKATERIRARMKKLIEGVANSRHYDPFVHFFRKQVS